MTGDIAHAEAILRAACGDRVRAAFPMAPLSTFRIGGPAALFLEPESETDLAVAGEAVREAQIPYVVLGKGSNVLVSDRGFNGLVLRLGRAFRWAHRDGDRLSAGGSMPLPALAGVALGHGLAGLEWAVAIPASFGGAVRMNAGAHGGSLADVLETIGLFDLTLGEPLTVEAKDAGFGYRCSQLPDDGVVVHATVRLEPGDPEGIRARMDEVREWRREHQPLAEPNCGSVFKNPRDAFAARLIEEAGLKGTTIGGAAVSGKHANFIVTCEGARAADVVELIRAVQERVLQRSHIRLEPEVHLVGEFDRVPH
ncbi:MAG: UDP-N-acetylmuramate dehydrogenase [Actinomycetota bacterium]